MYRSLYIIVCVLLYYINFRFQLHFIDKNKNNEMKQMHDKNEAQEQQNKKKKTKSTTHF